jgi:flagellar hook protein FlgE
MALSSALFSGISGLSSLGNAMQVIGDNIANVNTVGFKGSNFTFQDLLSQSISTQSGTSQVGRGVAIGDVAEDFGQGSFESTGSTTDLAIGGDGFFELREPGSNNLFYTRAGNFQFDKNGYLSNPEGYIAQGWQVDANSTDVGAVTDVRLDSFTSPPEASDQMTVIANLDAGETDTSSLATLTGSWDGSSGGMQSSANYSYQSTVKVYDSLGSTHDVTTYYSKDPTTANGWNYIVTCNPSEDNRAGAQAGGPPPVPTEGAGLLAQGTIQFSDSSGTISDMTMNSFNGTNYTNTALPANWTAETADSATGYLEFHPDFLGGAGTGMTVSLDLGTHSSDGGTTWTNDSLTSTQYSASSSTTFQSATGYGAGDLQGVDVSTDGVITGSYSNGQLIPLYRVALAKFQNDQGLQKQGNSLYRETRDSGLATTNMPGTNGLGSISPNSLEQSNVDIASEFVKMITTQRGFQANSKIITTTDQMLADLINLKQ